MKLPAILAALVVASVSFAAGGRAHADRVKRRSVEVRQLNTATRLIGCSPAITYCEGVTSVRTGLVVIDLASRHVRKGPVSFVGMFQGAARPADELLASQVIMGAGPRVSLGNSWVQAGLGVAGAHTAPGPKTILATSVLRSMRSGALLGVGTHLAAFDVPLDVTLDVGSNLGVDHDRFGDIYQVTASVFTPL